MNQPEKPQLTLQMTKAMYHDKKLKQMLANPNLQKLIAEIVDCADDHLKEQKLQDAYMIPIFREFKAQLEQVLEQNKPFRPYYLEQE